MNIKKYIKLISIMALVLCVCFIFIFYLYLYPLKYKKQINLYANESGLDSYLIASVINAESSFNRKAISNKGAVGLMQIMPTTAMWVCDKIGEQYEYDRLFEPEYNIKIGTYYLSYLAHKFNNVDTAIVAYNAGEGTVSKWLKINTYSDDGVSLEVIPYSESKNYLNKIKRSLNIYKVRFF